MIRSRTCWRCTLCQRLFHFMCIFRIILLRNCALYWAREHTFKLRGLRKFLWLLRVNSKATVNLPTSLGAAFPVMHFWPGESPPPPAANAKGPKAYLMAIASLISGSCPRLP